MNNIGISQRSIGIVNQDTGSVKIHKVLSYDLVGMPGFDIETPEQKSERLRKERIQKINIALDDTNIKDKK